jgi:hypothetical protein
MSLLPYRDQRLSPWRYSSRSMKPTLSSPSSAEVKNGAAIPPLSHNASWRCAQLIKSRNNFTFLNIYHTYEIHVPVLSIHKTSLLLYDKGTTYTEKILLDIEASTVVAY